MWKKIKQFFERKLIVQNNTILVDSYKIRRPRKDEQLIFILPAGIDSEQVQHFRDVLDSSKEEENIIVCGVKVMIGKKEYKVIQRGRRKRK